MARKAIYDSAALQTASDTNYTAAGDAYDGTPLKVVPSLGLLKQGPARPKRQQPGQYMNWILNQIAQVSLGLIDHTAELEAADAAEITARNAAIAAEGAARTAAIAAEAAARAAAIVAEANVRQNAVAQEVADRTNADNQEASTRNTNDYNEQTARIAADAAHTASINNLYADYVVKVLAADLTTTSTSVWASTLDFVADYNEEWTVEVNGWFQCSGNGGQIGFQNPSAVNLQGFVVGEGAAGVYKSGSMNGSGLQGSIFSTSTGALTPIRMFLTFKASASIAGVVYVCIASGANGQTCTLKAGTMMIARRGSAV